MVSKEKKTYWVSYTTSSGFSENTEMNIKALRNLVKQENAQAVEHIGKDGRPYFDYGLKIKDIRTPYISGRDAEFFSPGISKADKYTDKASGYFIKDTRTNFKVLAPGTEAILIFDSKQEASDYYFEHEDEIVSDYVAQKDSWFDVNDTIYESVVHANDQHVGSLNLSGKGSVFPESNIYVPADIDTMQRMVGSYEDFHSRNEYAQNLRFMRPVFSNFVNENLREIGSDEVYLDVDKFDPSFKATFEQYVHAYPEMVNQDIVDERERESVRKKFKLKLDNLQQKADETAENHGFMQYEPSSDLEDDLVF